MVEHTRSLGWLLQEEKIKGITVPLEAIPALGIMVSLKDQTFRLKTETLELIVKMCQEIAGRRSCALKALAELAGQIVSRTHCLGSAARIRTRAMYRNIEARLKLHETCLTEEERRKIGWSRQVPVHPNVKGEVNFWIQNIGRLNGQPFKRGSVLRSIDMDTDTDASKDGWGAVLYLPDITTSVDQRVIKAAMRVLQPNMSMESIKATLQDGIKVKGMFSQEEAKESSNVRELLATKYTFIALREFMKNLRIDHRMDNKGAVQALGG
jgi:hypothetical protein